MAKIILDHCCCCIGLRLGSFIIGYSDLILCCFLLLSTYFNDMAPDLDRYEISDNMMGVIYLKLITYTSLGIFDIILLIGLHQNKPSCVKFYLIAYSTYLGIYIIISLLTLIAMVILIDVDTAISTAFFCLVGYLLAIYDLLVVRSYHDKMLDDRDAAAFYNAQKDTIVVL